MKVSLVIPGYNNLRHLKNAYESVRKHYKNIELILIDDGSNDGTIEWLESLKDKNLKYWREEERIGHTILYDKGIEAASNDIIGILHADMYIAPNYLENLLKHLTPGKVVCATRVEPPLHPVAAEKIIADFLKNKKVVLDDLKSEEILDYPKEIFKKGYIRTLPIYYKNFGEMDGFFIARLRKISDN